MISILEDLIKGVYKGFESPENAEYYLFGIVIGIGIFWGFLNTASIIVGGTIADVIFSGAGRTCDVGVNLMVKSCLPADSSCPRKRQAHKRHGIL